MTSKEPLVHRSIVVKLGTAVLTHGSDRLDEQFVEAIARQAAELIHARAQVIIVTSGAIAAGRQVVGNRGRNRGVSTLQAMAAVGQSRLMQVYDRAFSANGLPVGQALVTRADLTSRRAAANVRRTLRELLELGVVPIVNENDVVATDEIDVALGDNDTLSAALANLVAADLLVLLTDQDGLYESDPRGNPDARLVRDVDRVTDEVLRMAAEVPGEQGRGGMASKVHAAAEATSWGTAVIVANGHEPDVLRKAAYGEPVGTHFHAWGRRHPAARRRSLGRVFVRGQLVVDEGAANALRAGRSSLLAVGVRDVRGSFEAGDVVEILGPDGAIIARGAVAYPADLMRQMMGLRSTEIRAVAQQTQPDEPYHGDEMIHRNHMTVV